MRKEVYEYIENSGIYYYHLYYFPISPSKTRKVIIPLLYVF